MSACPAAETFTLKGRPLYRQRYSDTVSPCLARTLAPICSRSCSMCGTAGPRLEPFRGSLNRLHLVSIRPNGGRSAVRPAQVFTESCRSSRGRRLPRNPGRPPRSLGSSTSGNCRCRRVVTEFLPVPGRRPVDPQLPEARIGGAVCIDEAVLVTVIRLVAAAVQDLMGRVALQVVQVDADGVRRIVVGGQRVSGQIGGADVQLVGQAR